MMLSQNQPPETEIGTRSGYFTFWMRSTVATTYRPVLHRRPKARNPTANRMLFVFFPCSRTCSMASYGFR